MLNILNHGFGEDSENVSQFHQAKWAGEHYMGGMSPRLIQQNFEKRVEALAAMLRSSLAELELMMPEPELAGSYEPGDEYQFYRDLKTIVGFSTSDLFIIDNYLDTQLFDVYMENVSPSVAVRVLTSQVSDSLRAVAEKFSKRGNFELRSSKDVHDRVAFADDRCWVIGQSIKDAARKKPFHVHCLRSIPQHSGVAKRALRCSDGVRCSNAAHLAGCPCLLSKTIVTGFCAAICKCGFVAAFWYLLVVMIPAHKRGERGLLFHFKAFASMGFAFLVSAGAMFMFATNYTVRCEWDDRGWFSGAWLCLLSPFALLYVWRWLKSILFGRN